MKMLNSAKNNARRMVVGPLTQAHYSYMDREIPCAYSLDLWIVIYAKLRNIAIERGT